MTETACAVEIVNLSAGKMQTKTTYGKMQCEPRFNNTSRARVTFNVISATADFLKIH